ncbi:MAG: hypothetical protein RL006_145 [Chloroflexota bacterium]|jgi:hypothetical protein
MAIKSAHVSVNSTAPTLIVSADNDGCRATVHNKTGTVTYLGGSDVTSSSGLGIDSGAGPVSFLLQPGDRLYAITASSTATVQVMTIGNV